MEYGLIGEKLGHSFSKTIHNELGNFNYELKEISLDEFDLFMRKADFKAISVTIPYKEKVIPYLYEISPKAKSIGAVNTIVNKHGKLYGYNTDCLGLESLILKENIEIKDKKVLILGSGGTSKTAFNVANDLGAKLVLRVSRDGKKGTITYDEANTVHNDAQIIINTTPVGMYPNIGKAVVDIDNFKNLSGVVDAVYNPINSALVTKAKEKGIKAAGGLYMLVSQAVFAAQKFFDREIAKTETDRIYTKLIKEKLNLVLIGMPGSGKTTIGSEVAKALNKDFYDTDEVIYEKYNMTAGEIINNFGEADFRKKEHNVIKELSAVQNSVIATGGGAVLNGENISYLKENGIIIFIDRDINELVTSNDRPLSSNRELLEKRFNERYSLYKNAADLKIDAVKDLKTNINTVLEVFKNENFSY